MACQTEYTLSYKKTGVNGWTSFHSFNPDYMAGMGVNFYSFKDGNIYLHHSDIVDRNTYYGTQYESKIRLILNDMPSDVKVFKNLQLEGSDSWNALIEAYISDERDTYTTTITDAEFVKKEGMWFAYMRGNEDETKLDHNATYGIGEATDENANVITVPTVVDISEGDQIVRDDLSVVGTVVSVAPGLVTVDAIAVPVTGSFLFGKKNYRVEGAEMRGYSASVELDVTSNDKVELFSVNSEVFKSFS